MAMCWSRCEVPTGFVVLPRRWVVERTPLGMSVAGAWSCIPDRKRLIATARVWLAQTHEIVSRLAV